jgi:hypothetical protein
MIDLISSNLHRTPKKLRQPTLEFFASPRALTTSPPDDSGSETQTQSQSFSSLDGDGASFSQQTWSQSQSSSSSEQRQAMFLVPRLVERECNGDCIRLSQHMLCLFERMQRLFFLSPSAVWRGGSAGIRE